MPAQRLVIVGASLAGLRAAEAARRAGFDGTVTLVGAEQHLPYDRPPLSKEFLSEAAEPGYFRDESSLREELGVDLQLGVRATALRSEQRTVVAGDREIGYTGLVIATGARARELAGTPKLRGVHTLRTLDDARDIRAALGPGVRTVIIGAGFIGSEIASSARKAGAEVTVLEAAPVPLVGAVGEQMGAACARLHERNGTALRCDAAVTSIEGTESVEAVVLASGERLPADLVIVGVGAVPETGWLDGAGLRLDDGLVCDETLAAGPAGVYAAGDIARWPNPLFGQTMRLEHWTSAAEQGAIAAHNALTSETPKPCSTVPYFWSDLYGSRIQFVGVADADEVHVASGDTGTDSFLALYRRGGHVVGALGLNQRRPVMKLRAMITRHGTWQDALDMAAG